MQLYPIAAYVFVPSVLGKYSDSLIRNNTYRNCLLGHRKKKSQIFNEDFYLPLYLPLWLWFEDTAPIVASVVEFENTASRFGEVAI